MTTLTAAETPAQKLSPEDAETSAAPTAAETPAQKLSPEDAETSAAPTAAETPAQKPGTAASAASVEAAV
ncbi:hypothetical protein [Streptomyces adonidis]|uniref:hypothetical protein n=1 Tax=Streptomyces adonidis TaxID=3231367 RepID=UPI0034DAE37D